MIHAPAFVPTPVRLTPRERVNGSGAVYHLCDFQPVYAGSFVWSLIALHETCLERLRVPVVAVFPAGAQDRAWVETLRHVGVECRFLKAGEGLSAAVGSGPRPVALHAHFTGLDLCALAWKREFAPQVPLIWHVHALSVGSWKQRARDVVKIRWLANRWVDAVMAVGPAVVANLRARGYPRDRIHGVTNGVATERFAATWAPASPLGAPQDPHRPCTFFLLGWEPRRKGVDLLVEAAAQLAPEPWRDAYVIIGQEETRRCLEGLKAAARLGDRLKLIEPVPDLAQLMPGLDVLVSASRSEAFGYAIAESAAAGKLIVCSEITGSRELFGGLPGAWFFDPDRPETLAACLRAILALTPERRRELGAANRDASCQGFSLQRWAREVTGIYRQLGVGAARPIHERAGEQAA